MNRWVLGILLGLSATLFAVGGVITGRLPWSTPDWWEHQ